MSASQEEQRRAIIVDWQRRLIARCPPAVSSAARQIAREPRPIKLGARPKDRTRSPAGPRARVRDHGAERRARCSSTSAGDATSPRLERRHQVARFAGRSPGPATGPAQPDVFVELSGHEPIVAWIGMLDEQEDMRRTFERRASYVRQGIAKLDHVTEAEAHDRTLVIILAWTDELYARACCAAQESTRRARAPARQRKALHCVSASACRREQYAMRPPGRRRVHPHAHLFRIITIGDARHIRAPG